MGLPANLPINRLDSTFREVGWQNVEQMDAFGSTIEVKETAPRGIWIQIHRMMRLKGLICMPASDQLHSAKPACPKRCSVHFRILWPSSSPQFHTHNYAVRIA